MNEELDAIDAVSRAVDRVTRHGRFGEIRLVNGIVLKLKPVAPLLLQAVQQEFQAPNPPKIYIEEKGREEENPNDPAYIREIDQLVNAQALALNNLLLGVGTEFVSAPEGYYPPDSDEWITQVEFAGSIANTDLKINKEDKIKRYLCWLRFYAIENGADLALCESLPMHLAGIREGEVEEVVDSFRSLPERRPNSEGSPTSISQNGNTANRAGRRASTRTRGA